MTEQEMAPAKTLAWIQAQVRAPKGQFNAFGKYKYRSAEDILEAVKVVINPIGYYLTINDQVVQLGDRFYVVAHVELTNGFNRYTATAYAREEDAKKGMDGAQVTGAASSYARKYALSGLFALDDTKDADATNTHGKEAQTADQWAAELAACRSQADLLALYGKYKDQVEGSAYVKAAFSTRKKELQ